VVSPRAPRDGSTGLSEDFEHNANGGAAADEAAAPGGVPQQATAGSGIAEVPVGSLPHGSRILHVSFRVHLTWTHL
jgi:hypothetical protein